MTRRRLCFIIIAGWIALALMRVAANIGGGLLHEISWQRLLYIGFGVALIWAPISVLILGLDRSRVSSRTPTLVAARGAGRGRRADVGRGRSRVAPTEAVLS